MISITLRLKISYKISIIRMILKYGKWKIVKGDGYKYRDQGGHLTWKNSYKKTSNYFGIDFITDPDNADSIGSFANLFESIPRQTSNLAEKY